MVEFKVTHAKTVGVFWRKKKAHKTRKSVYTLKINVKEK